MAKGSVEVVVKINKVQVLKRILKQSRRYLNEYTGVLNEHSEFEKESRVETLIDNIDELLRD